VCVWWWCYKREGSTLTNIQRFLLQKERNCPSSAEQSDVACLAERIAILFPILEEIERGKHDKPPRVNQYVHHVHRIHICRTHVHNTHVSSTHDWGLRFLPERRPIGVCKSYTQSVRHDSVSHLANERTQKSSDRTRVSTNQKTNHPINDNTYRVR
jgi:hypothetical protein